MLEKDRRRTAETLGSRPYGVATCEVFDALIARVRAVIEKAAPDAGKPLLLIKNHAGDIAATLRIVARALEGIAAIDREAKEVLVQQRQPFIRLLERIESEGYTVDTDTFTTVTDGWDWSPDADDTETVQEQLEAEKASRAEQAARYQQRLERMDTAFNNLESAFGERLRDLIEPLPDVLKSP
ncbi:hypothetical protein BKG68_04220 [Mycobacteroides saopaulense]|uniref:Uncharacterized protein n=2 Tax=Mycobacteroides saopaulense TaxID=1578165 RepID=A0ABX3C6N7_9MYCO|nr:hypothetical protein BKG68_04220 [Mycobacteroides saopaulense]OHU14233.1 hypothetical protein BKG73_04230 [Mycobacteroides saopaulense]